MKHSRKSIIYLLLFLLIGTGCTNSANHDNKSAKLNATNVSYQETTNGDVKKQVRQLLMKQEEVRKIIVVSVERELFIAIQINQMDRFQLKEIEQRLTKMVKANYPNEKVFLSVDKKIFLELEKVEKQVNGTDMNEKKLKKELNRLKKLSNELT